MKIHSVILTGTRDAHSPLLDGTGLKSKVLLPVGGKPMVLSVLEAISGSEHRPEIWVSTNDPDVIELETAIAYNLLPTEERAVDSLLRSLERIPGDDPILVACGDHPLLTSVMVDYFVDACLSRRLTFGVAAVNWNRVRQRYPESQRTCFPAKDGSFSGGNLMWIDRTRFNADAGMLALVDEHRKRPWSSLSLLGWRTMVDVLLRRIDIHEIGRRASVVIGCETGIVDMPFAECCMDVDKPADRVLAEQIMMRRQYLRKMIAVSPSTTLAEPVSPL